MDCLNISAMNQTLFTVTQAAAKKNTTRQTIYRAIQIGALLTATTETGQTVISWASLRPWKPDKVKQACARKKGNGGK